jgi:hypothetical protein
MDLLDCAEDHRRGALDGPAQQVPWAVAVMYLGEPPVDRYGLAVRAGGHVAAIRKRWLPPVRVTHPFPEARFAATHPR